jgi:hypothetical protein
MKRKVMAMFLVSLMAVSLLGVAYAHWDDTVQIEGTVHMGEFIVGILDIKMIGDNEDTFDPPKEVAECYVELLEPETSVHHVPTETVYKVMLVTTENAYPNYINYIKFNLKNAGTIPAHIKTVTITAYDETDAQDLAVVEVAPGHYDIVDPVVGAIINLWLYKQETGAPLESNQLEPCTAEPVDLVIEFKQEAEECHTYTYKIEIYAIQWNKN